MKLLEAKYADYVPEFPETHKTPAQRAGILFEQKVGKRLSTLGLKIETGPWLYYRTANGGNVCQPDILIWFKPNLLCIAECKLTWKKPVRQKLLNLYGPVLQHIYPDVELSYLQIYKNSKHGCHKRKLSLYSLEDIKPGAYKECQILL